MQTADYSRPARLAFISPREIAYKRGGKFDANTSHLSGLSEKMRPTTTKKFGTSKLRVIDARARL